MTDLADVAAPRTGTSPEATTPGTAALLEAHSLVKRYGPRTVVDRVSFRVRAGEIVGLLGPNGAGKTTSFRMTIGMIEANEGQVVFDGRDVTRLPMYQRARLGMGYLAQEPSVFQRLSILDNLLAILETRPDLNRRERKEAAMDLIRQFNLDHKINHPAYTCSGGERRKLEIARALTTNPKLILLDEPFSGVDPRAVEDLQQQIFALRDLKQIAMLITDHNAPQTLRTCDRAYVIVAAQLLREGTPRELIKDEDVRAKYLANSFKGDEFD